MTIIDTDIAIDVLRKFPAALAWSNSKPGEDFVISGFTALELLAGCHNTTQQRAVDAMVQRFRLIWPSARFCEQALQSYRASHLSGGIGAFDVLIGQTAIELGLPLHTFNVKHYSQVAGLVTVQPYMR